MLRRLDYCSCWKKSLPLSSTRMKAGKSTTSIAQIASIPSSGYSRTSTFLMFSGGEDRGRAAGGAEVEAAVLPAGLGHLLAAVPLGDHDERAAVGLEKIHVGVHPSGGRRAEGARGHSLGRLGRPRVVDRVVLEVLRQARAGVEPLLQLRVRDVARDDEPAGQGERRGDRVLRQLRQDLRHRAVQIDADEAVVAPGLRCVADREELLGMPFQLLEPDPVLVDLAQDVAVGRAGHAHSDRAGGAMPRKADDADVVGEVLAAELRAETGLLRRRQQLRFELRISERAAGLIAARRKPS